MALIDEVADQCGLFISDLKAQDNHSVVAGVLKQIDAEAFSAADWNHFMAYLFEEEETFTDAKQARQACLDKLKPQ